MIKNVIAPIQAWLLSQGRCVGCSVPLAKGKHAKHKDGEKITCNCGRIYIKDTKSYRRALVSEV
jgi:hypothetical protein